MRIYLDYNEGLTEKNFKYFFINGLLKKSKIDINIFRDFVDILHWLRLLHIKQCIAHYAVDSSSLRLIKR